MTDGTGNSQSGGGEEQAARGGDLIPVCGSSLSCSGWQSSHVSLTTERHHSREFWKSQESLTTGDVGCREARRTRRRCSALSLQATKQP